MYDLIQLFYPFQWAWATLGWWLVPIGLFTMFVLNFLYWTYCQGERFEWVVIV